MITDTESKHCVLMEDYIFDPDLTEDEKFQTIKYIIDDHHLLLANFWKEINLICKNKSFAFVPISLFHPDSPTSYIGSNAAFDPALDEVVIAYHTPLKFVNIFTVSKSIKDLMGRIYPRRKINYQHQSSALINGVIAMNGHMGRDMVIYLDRFGMHIILAQDKQLLYYNQYQIKKFEDYLKYVKMVAAELHISLETEKISLYGYLGKNTPHFQALKKSIPGISLGNRPQLMNFSYVFDELLDHQYFDLFSIETSN
ncbi:MAG: DUF3822 family protein [Cyclobacteriaceae bacterium]|nr:DUF3822 family protein [Cyclobacteriaceae bacterium]